MIKSFLFPSGSEPSMNFLIIETGLLLSRKCLNLLNFVRGAAFFFCWLPCSVSQITKVTNMRRNMSCEKNG